MRIIKNFSLAVWVLFAIGCCVKQVGPDTNYHLDTKEGNNSNTGLSKKQAWKSQNKANALQLKAGDSLLLRYGTVKRKSEINTHGNADCRIVVDAYEHLRL